MSRMPPRVGVIIPTYNAARYWGQLQQGLEKQNLQQSQIVIIDSSSTDNTRSLAQRAGYEVVRIPKSEFNHGATRGLACSYLPNAELLVFMTQDAVLANSESIRNLCAPLGDPDVGAAYGRQLPRVKADPIERHGRIFNYPETSQVRSFEDRNKLGFKTAFFSNSFAVYRRTALEEVGGFPSDTIVSEEVTAVAKMLMAGWKIAYQADAEVFHSHHLNLSREFSRYFDIGVHHGRTAWLRETFGTTTGDGVRYIRSELSYLRANHPLWVPYAALRNISKYVAYHLGVHENRLPDAICQLLSGNVSYWNKPPAAGPQPQAMLLDEKLVVDRQMNLGRGRVPQKQTARNRPV